MKTTTNTTNNTTSIKAAAQKAVVVKTNNTNDKEMVSMVRTNSEVLTKALKTVLGKAGIKFPKELQVSLQNGRLYTNAAKVLIIKAGLSPITNHGKKMMHNFPYRLAVESAKRINDVLGSDLYINAVKEVLTKVEERQSLLVTPDLTDRQEKMVGLLAAVQTKIDRQKRSLAFAKFATVDRVRNTNRKVTKAVFAKYQDFKDTVEDALVAEDEIAFVPKMNMSKFIVENRKNIMKKDSSVSINVIKVTSDDNGNFNTSILISKMDENEAIRKGLIKPCTALGQTYNARFGKLGYECDNFSKDIIMLDLQGAPKACFNLMNIFVWWNGVRTIFATLQDGEYIDLCTNQVVKRRTAPMTYKVIGGSPSSLRKSQVLAFNVTDGMKHVDDMLDALTEGAYSKEYNKQISVEQLAKYVTRFFSWTAPNKVVGTINHAAIYMGKWCNDALDGAGYLFSKFYAKCMENITGLKVKPQDVVGIGVQCRPYSAKVFAPVVDESLFELLCAEADGVVYIPMVTPEISRKLDEAFHGIKNEYYNKVIVFGEEGCDPEFLSDLNGYKTVFNWGQPTGLRVLDIAKSGIAHTSIQMWEVPLDVNAHDCIELMKNLREEMVGDIFDQLFIDRKVKVPSLIDIEKNFYPHNVIKDIAPDYVLDKDMAMFKKIVEELATRDNNASNKFKWEIDGEYARLTSDLSLVCSKLGILQYGEGYSPAANRYFTNGDNAEKYFECSGKVREMWGKRIVSMFKYPKMGRREFYRFSSLPLDVIKRRINNLDIEKSYKKALIKFFACLKPGMLVVPGVALLKQQCAGLDFDYDGATCVFDCRFNALLPEDIQITNIVLKEEKPVIKAEAKGLAARINKSINKTSSIELTAENLHHAYLTYLNANSDGWSVGSVTNCNSTQLAVLQLAKSTHHPYYINMMKEMLGRWFGNDAEPALGGTGAYKGLPKREVSLCNMDDAFVFGADVESEEYAVSNSTHAIITDVSKHAINEAIEEMIDADWGNEDILIHIFEDLNDIFRFYQEVIIDSAKTGKMVKVAIAPGRAYHAAEINDNTISFAWDYELAKSKFKVNVNESAPSSRKTIFKDRLFRIRTSYLVKDLEDSMKAIFNEKECKLSMHDLEVLGNAFANAQYKELNKAFFFLKKVYGDVTRNWQNNRELAGDDEEALAIVNKNYKKEIARITNMGRRLTANMSDYRRGAYSKFVSAFTMDNKGNCSPAANGGNNFGANVFQKEFMIYVLKHYAQIDFCGEKLSYNALYQDGDKVLFNHGINEYAVTTADLTGEYIIREFNGQFYATRQIVDVLPDTTTNEAVTIRINKEANRSFKEIFDTLKNGMDVELHAFCDVSDRNNKIFDFGMYDAEGNKLCDIDEGGSLAIRNLVNGKQGKIESIIFDTTQDVNGYKKEFLIVTVK